ncbi:hypothetical protein EDB82DRAFT_485783 [Fusarium venenatum]|uniref:uncharacterized protein n=1 Tax=Fusarium venenatum TaxID=56646 RepID=UPI001E0E7DCD|nr:hypothetical protein EDB82DRAFT_485783 [Fusarium venenatum]
MLAPLDLGFGWPSEQGMAAIAYSSYSPLALRDMPQPKPNDAPSDIDPSIFTFEDAFEDLLAVSQGQSLPDIKSRYEQRKLLRSMFPTGEPGYFWLRRLRSQGLLEESVPTRLMKSVAEKNWDRFHQELDRSAQAVWRAALGEDEGADSFSAHEQQHDENKRDVALSSQQRNRERIGLNQDIPTHHDVELLRDELHEGRSKRREPEHFDDLFSAIQSSFATGQSAWDSFVKLLNEDPAPPLNQERKQLQKPASDEKQVVTKDEYVDRFGYLHTKTLVKTLDENGNEVGSHSHYTVRPAPKDNANGQIEEQGKDNQESGFKANGSLETKKSWLWK